MPDLPLTKISETASTITLGWTPPSGAVGYYFFADSNRVSNSTNGLQAQVKFKKVASGQYAVQALGVSAEGQYPSVVLPPLGGFEFIVNPKGVATTVYVDYGTDFKAFASTTGGVAIGSGSSDVAGAIQPTGLLPNTVYFYRVRAVSTSGQSISDTRWFITDPSSSTVRQVGAGQTYATISAAIAAASAGDTIVVHAGSYAGITINRQFSSLVRIVRNGTDVVSIRNVLHSGASNIYWGPGFAYDGSSFSGSSGSRILEFQSSSFIYMDTSTSTFSGVATGDISPFWIGSNCSWIFAMGGFYAGGGVMKGYTGNKGDPAGWPIHCRFLGCDFHGQSADIWHQDGMNDWVYERTWHHDPNTTSIPDEHHDGIQTVYGNTLLLRRVKFSWANANQNGNNNAIIVGDYSGLAVPNVTLENVLVNGWNGSGFIQQGASVTQRNCTFYNCRGVVGGPVSQQNEDWITGAPGDTTSMKNVVAYKPYTNGGGTPPTGSNNHFQQGSNFAGGLTNTTTGVPQFVSAGTDFRPALGGNLDKTGASDSSTPLWDHDGRGYGSSVSRGCFAPSDVTTPLVVSAGYTP